MIAEYEPAESPVVLTLTVTTSGSFRVRPDVGLSVSHGADDATSHFMPPVPVFVMFSVWDRGFGPPANASKVMDRGSDPASGLWIGRCRTRCNLTSSVVQAFTR